MIKRDLTKMTLNISQPHLITKTTNMKSLMNLNTPDTLHTGIVWNQ